MDADERSTVSFDKAIASGKEHRRPYYRSKRFDRTCRPGGSCPWCRRNRQISDLRRREAVHDRITEREE
jgi:hypothetical protein